jgi:phage terminase large subunit
MLYQETTATRKIASLRKRIRGVSGGTSASKTISILLWLIGYAQTVENEVISVVSETLPHLKRGAIRDFILIMQAHNYYEEDRWNRTDFIYTFETGSKIEFFSADQPERVRGPRRDVLFINEANNVSYETYTQLEIRTRKMVWLDWNPVAEFWFYTDVQPYRDDVDFLVLTYKDNEALSPQEVSSLEQHKNNPNMAQWWRVYGEGLLGEAEGRIFTGWEIVDTIPDFARLECYGLDFGYTNDPTSIIAAYKFNDGFVLDEVCYTKGLSNKAIADTLLNRPRALILADSAEPKSIDEIKLYGLDIVGSLKGQGSVLQGIQFVQQHKIAVTKQSTNLIKEYRNYLWMKDKEGRIINDPAPVFNHAMDAVRYALSKYFVDIDTPRFNEPDMERIRAAGKQNTYGGIGWDRSGLAR